MSQQSIVLFGRFADIIHLQAAASRRKQQRQQRRQRCEHFRHSSDVLRDGCVLQLPLAAADAIDAARHVLFSLLDELSYPSPYI